MFQRSQRLDTTMNDFVVKAMSKLPGEVLHILFEQFLTHPVWHLAANCGVWIRPDGPSLDWSIEAHLRLKATILLQVLPEVLEELEVWIVHDDRIVPIGCWQEVDEMHELEIKLHPEIFGAHLDVLVRSHDALERDFLQYLLAF